MLQLSNDIIIDYLHYLIIIYYLLGGVLLL